MATRAPALATCTFLLLAVVLAASCPPAAHALAGNVYAGTLERCYRHPVAGVIEDSGGEGAYATGQGMIEGCLSDKTQLEVTDDGRYFLTIRLSLIDYTRDRNFTVQKWGARRWSKTEFAVTKKTKVHGETAYDYCIRIPSQKSIVRMTMFVNPIGREVVCYFYPRKLELGAQAGMSARIVTEKSKKGSGKERLETEGAASDEAADGKQRGAGSSETSELGDPDVNAAVGSAQGLTLSVAGEGAADDAAVQRASLQGTPGLLQLASAAPAWQLVAAIVACMLALAALCVALAFWHRRRRVANDPDDYACVYAAQERERDQAHGQGRAHLREQLRSESGHRGGASQ